MLRLDTFRRFAVILLFIAAPEGRFRGGRQGRRERWFGLEDKPDFDDFRHWWHREGKFAVDGKDFPDRESALDAYEQWCSEGRPRAK
jgi:hypothetical protein